MENWKEIRGYKNYMVSSTGKVRSKERYIKHSSGKGKCLLKGKLLKPSITGSKYLSIRLNKEGKRKFFKIHRLVAQAFISNPDNKETVNHINGIKTDNNISNLEWNTRSENIQHSYDTGLNNQEHSKKKILVYSNDYKYIFDSLSEACKELNLNLGNLSMVSNGKLNSTKGYYAKYI